MLLWLRSGDTASAVGNWVCLVLLALGLAQAIALWQTPSVRLPIAAGRGAGERVVDTTSVHRELTRAVITGHELFAFGLAQHQLRLWPSSHRRQYMYGNHRDQ